MNIRLTGLFTLRSPLSHIGESIGINTYLVQEPLIQPDGSVEEIFSYSGNAWRGQLRDLAAAYMLDHLGGQRVSLDTFHFLFSGGKIGGKQVIDVNHARRMREAIPMIAVWGGGAGNMLLGGKMRVGNSYPLCREALVALPEALHEQASKVEYRGLTFEKSFVRQNDARKTHLEPYMQQSDLAQIEGEVAAKADDGPAQQMRYFVELVAAGAKLYTEIELLDANDVELGALVSALHQFSRSPHIGGQANKGHGKVSLKYQMLDLDSGETRDFLSVTDGPALLALPAARAKDAYDQHLRSQYDTYLSGEASEIKALLGATT